MQVLPFVSVIIVNYNSGQYALACLASLQQQKEVRLEVIVVDNHSTDDSVSMLRGFKQGEYQLIESPQNLGFSKANNLAAKQARGDFLLILNPDTVLEQADSISRLINRLQTQPNIGMMAPLINEPRKNKRVLARMRYPASKSLKNTSKLRKLPGKVAWVLGACMLFKRAAFNQINGFDEDYFLYGEDADICLRLRLAGYAIGFDEAVAITHVAGASEFGANSLDKWLRKKRGIFLFFYKHYDVQDLNSLTQKMLRKAHWALWWLRVTALVRDQNTAQFVDQKNRLLATITAANELKSKLINGG